MAIVSRNEIENEWCNICGKRSNDNADVWYPVNAEHGMKNTQYIRICFDCITKMANVLINSGKPQTG